MKMDKFLETVGGDPALQRLIELVQLLSTEDRKHFLDALKKTHPKNHAFLVEFFDGKKA